MASPGVDIKDSLSYEILLAFAALLQLVLAMHFNVVQLVVEVFSKTLIADRTLVLLLLP